MRGGGGGEGGESSPVIIFTEMFGSQAAHGFESFRIEIGYAFESIWKVFKGTMTAYKRHLRLTLLRLIKISRFTRTKKQVFTEHRRHSSPVNLVMKPQCKIFFVNVFWNNINFTGFVPFFRNKFPGLFQAIERFFESSHLAAPQCLSRKHYHLSLHISRIFQDLLLFSRTFQSWKMID